VEVLGHAAELIAELADVAAVAGAQHDHAELARMWRQRLAQPSGVDDRGPSAVIVPGQPVRLSVRCAVAEDVQHRDRPIRARRGRQRLLEPGERDLGNHVGLIIERMMVLAADAPQSAQVVARRHPAASVRPCEQDAPALAPRPGLGRGPGLGPGVAEQHACQLAQVLAAGADREQLPWQGIELGRRGAYRDVDRLALAHRPDDLLLVAREVGRLQEPAEPLAHALHDRRIASRHAHGVQIVEQRITPLQGAAAEPAALGA